MFVTIVNGAAGSVGLEESRPWSLVPTSLRSIFTDEISLDQTNPLVNTNLLEKVNFIVVPSWTYAVPLSGCRGADNSHFFFICLSIYLFCKVRRSAAKCLSAVLGSRPELLSEFYKVVSPALIARFKGEVLCYLSLSIQVRRLS